MSRPDPVLRSRTARILRAFRKLGLQPRRAGAGYYLLMRGEHQAASYRAALGHIYCQVADVALLTPLAETETLALVYGKGGSEIARQAVKDVPPPRHEAAVLPNPPRARAASLVAVQRSLCGVGPTVQAVMF